MTVHHTLVLLETLRHTNFIEYDDLLDDLIVKLQDILTFHIGRSVTLQKFKLSPYRLQLIENRLFLRVQRDPR